jgi:hypothetical protein
MLREKGDPGPGGIVNPQQVNTLGGLCEVAGVLVAVSDWLGVAIYK